MGEEVTMGRSRSNSLSSLGPKVEIDDYETRQLIPNEPKEIKASKCIGLVL